jgi:hypothetical protein
MGEVIGAITAETDYTPFGASAEAFGGNLAHHSKLTDEQFNRFFNDKSVDNNYLARNSNLTDEQFMRLINDNSVDNNYLARNPHLTTEQIDLLSSFGAEAFGGDLASLDDFNGVESVRVEAPLGHGVTENLGAEDINSYGGIVGVAAAFVTGMAYRHWANTKINGDDAPDSEAPSEESDDAPQA